MTELTEKAKDAIKNFNDQPEVFCEILHHRISSGIYHNDLNSLFDFIKSAFTELHSNKQDVIQDMWTDMHAVLDGGLPGVSEEVRRDWLNGKIGFHDAVLTVTNPNAVGDDDDRD